ncbi:MAG TPA: tRNA 2-thiouridine(34) synthase MnmA [Candidatus Paceibacterota bacterium]|nr:tRNA 2-thiouridine(34) synthase MnmA [Candidatus Paceibacterota bacterium]
MLQKSKVFVGISGGVDSSVSAYLLKQQGYDVHGIFVKTWSPQWLPCTWLDEKRDAMRICAALDIPFHFLDAEAEYKEGVADYMIEEYKAGRTPNPDVLCNRVIKFGSMWEYAKAHGADFIATGHYARIVSGNELVDSSEDKIQNQKAHADLSATNYYLLTGSDKSKDQSYFLWMLTQDDLAHTLFPIGQLEKSEVRTIAQEAGLFTATKKDSQGICFLGDVDMREFLGHYIEQKQGSVIDEKGNAVGTHDGAVFYTLGERHGFTITEQSTDRKPYYVVGKDLEKNLLIVSHEPKTKLHAAQQNITLRETNWIQNVSVHKQYLAHIRYHGALIPAKILSASEIKLKYDGVISLGQSLVLYDSEMLVGGGIIHEVNSA